MSRINRNIVECKVISHSVIWWRCYVLIETLWNVKGIFLKYPAQVFSVLIETLWNVKKVTFPALTPAAFMVLIETLWNVKIVMVFHPVVIFYRINRNIVECKVGKHSHDEMRKYPY